MKPKPDIAIAILQEQVKNIKDNDLKHLSDDIQGVKEDVKEVHDKVEKISNKLYYWSGGLAVLMVLLTLVEIYFSAKP